MRRDILPGGLDLAAKGVVFLFGVLLARNLGAEEFGLWSIASAVMVYCFLLIDFSSLSVGVRKLIDAGGAPSVFSEVLFLKFMGIMACFCLVVTCYVLNVIDFGLSVGIFLSSVIYFLNFEFCYRSKFKITFAALQNFIAAMIPLVIYVLFFSESSATADIIYLRAVSCFFVFLVFGLVFFKKNKTKYTLKLSSFNYWPYVHVLIGALLARLYFNSDVFLIQSILTMTDVGLYSAIATFYVIFITFRGVAINTIYPRLCIAYKEGTYKRLVYKYTAWFSIAIIPVLMVCYFFPEDIIELVFGIDYITNEALFVFEIYLFVAFILTLGFLMPNTLHVQGRAKSFMAITGVAAFINIGFNFLYLDYLGITAAAYSTLIAEFIVVSYSYFLFKRVSI